LYQSIKVSKYNILKVLSLLIFQFFNLFYYSFKFKPEYIYAHWLFPQALIASVVSKFTKTKLLFTSHGSDISLLIRLGFLGKFITKFTVTNAYKFTAVSNKNLNKINQMYNLSKINKKFEVIPMGVSKIFFDTPVYDNYLYCDKYQILFYGRLTHYKGVELLVDAFSNLHLKHPNLYLNIIGNGEQKDFIIKKITKLNLHQYIKVSSFKNKDLLINEIDKSDLVVVPSLESKLEFEAGPLSVIESMSRKRLCLVSDSVGFYEYTNNKNSLIFSSGNQESLENMLSKSLNLNQDEYKSKVNEAFKTSLEFDFNKISEKYFNFFFE